jgi:hypothetical protein
VEWEVEYTDQFEAWWNDLSEEAQEAIYARVLVLRRVGPALGRPSVDTVHSSRHGHMKELRVHEAGHALRILFAFDPRRRAILLIGGDKSGDPNWYETLVPLADQLYDEHLDTLKREGLGGT